MRLTEQQFADLKAKRGPRVNTSAPPFLPPSVAGMYALGRLKAGKMNKTEELYAQHLDRLKAAGEIREWLFEPCGLRLADRTFYHPDFGVLPRDGFYEFHEVKGRMMDDANVKLKVAADRHPFKFILVRKKGDGWTREDYSR